MIHPLITAAWSERVPGLGLVLKVAKGEPVWRAHARQLSDVVDCLEKAHAQSRQGLHVVGYVAYEAAPAFDSALPTVSSSAASSDLTAWLAYGEDQISEARLSDPVGPLPGDCVSPWLDVLGTDWFENSFHTIRGLIEQGEFYQLNLTTRLNANVSAQIDPWHLFQLLFQAQPSEHTVYLNVGVTQILSLSPELFFQWDGTRLQTSPMKGTRNPSDAHLTALSDSAKDRAENVMIVDLLRNDMARVCKPRSVQVQSLFDVMHLPTVEQMTSTIAGETRPNSSLSDVFKALFPCGSVTGAPKRQAMRHIADLERMPRGVYCGAMGCLYPGGRVKMNVPIRSLTLSQGRAEYGVGSGLTWYSKLESERKEWWQKTQFLRSVTTDFQLLETLRLDHGRWVRLDAHLNRMHNAARYFGFVWNRQTLMDQLQKVSKEYPQGVWKGRLLLNTQGDLTVQVDRLPDTPDWIEVRLSDRPMTMQGPWVQFKTTHRPHYDQYLPTQPQVFDTLLTDQAEMVTECCRFNVVFEIENRLLTPRMSTSKRANLLGGVFRSFLLGENTVFEADIALSDLGRVQRAWLINSLREWVEIDLLSSHKGEPLYQKANKQSRPV